MKQFDSKIVTSDQKGPHKDLIKIISNYSIENFRRPPAPFSLTLIDRILPVLERYPKIILDTGCGTGESSYNLALQNPDHFVLGIDKSQHRLDRRNDFKIHQDVSNYMIVRGELLDLWPLLYKHSRNSQWKIVKQCLYYPNPWPKAKAVKRRWHAAPIIPFIFGIGGQIELRSNWLIYMREFLQVTEYLTGKTGEIEQLYNIHPMTAFERKYYLSGQNLYKLSIEY